jgi:hypothetical protein
VIVKGHIKSCGWEFDSRLEKGILLVNLDVPMDYSNTPELPWQAQMLETLVLMLLPVHTTTNFRIYVE